MLHKPTIAHIALLGAPGTGAAVLAYSLREGLPTAAFSIMCFGAVPTALPALAPITCSAAQEATKESPGFLSQPVAVVLLMGLDLPCPTADRTAQEAADTQLRRALDIAGMPYKVVYGLGAARVQNALFAVENIASAYDKSRTSAVFDTKRGQTKGQMRPWNCEKCSDPVCEHRLFTALTGLRSSRAPWPEMSALPGPEDRQA